MPTGTRALILERAIPLFANVGITGTSMREIAKAVGITPAALYYHFPDKDSLYFEAMRYAYADQVEAFHRTIREEGPPWQRLEAFVTQLTEFLFAKPDVRRLFQRERLEGDEERLRLLVENMFQQQFEGLTNLAREIAPKFDPHLWAISVAGLVMYHVESGSIRRYLPGWSPEHEKPEAVARHVVRFLRGSVS